MKKLIYLFLLLSISCQGQNNIGNLPSATTPYNDADKFAIWQTWHGGPPYTFGGNLSGLSTYMRNKLFGFPSSYIPFGTGTDLTSDASFIYDVTSKSFNAGDITKMTLSLDNQSGYFYMLNDLFGSNSGFIYNSNSSGGMIGDLHGIGIDFFGRNIDEGLYKFGNTFSGEYGTYINIDDSAKELTMFAPNPDGSLGITRMDQSNGNYSTRLGSMGQVSQYLLNDNYARLYYEDGSGQWQHINVEPGKAELLQQSDTLSAGIYAQLGNVYIHNNDGVTNKSWTWPTTDGVSGRSLITDGSGNLSFGGAIVQSGVYMGSHTDSAVTISALSDIYYTNISNIITVSGYFELTMSASTTGWTKISVPYPVNNALILGNVNIQNDDNRSHNTPIYSLEKSGTEVKIIFVNDANGMTSTAKTYFTIIYRK